MTRRTDGTAFSLACRAPSEALSAAVSGPVVLAEITGTGIRLAVPNGAASAAARSTGALAGRNLVLSLWVTLESDGRPSTAAMPPTIQARVISQRKRTLNRPSQPKIASTCMTASVVEPPSRRRRGPVWPARRCGYFGHDASQGAGANSAPRLASIRVRRTLAAGDVYPADQCWPRAPRQSAGLIGALAGKPRPDRGSGRKTAA